MRYLYMALLTLVMAGCGFVPGGSTSPSTGASALCDPNGSTSIGAFAAMLDAIDVSGDHAQLTAETSEMLGDVQGLIAETDEIGEWRAASIDAIEQLQRRMNDPERLAAVADHAARTLRALASRICVAEASPTSS